MKLNKSTVALLLVFSLAASTPSYAMSTALATLYWSQSFITVLNGTSSAMSLSNSPPSASAYIQDPTYGFASSPSVNDVTSTAVPGSFATAYAISDGLTAISATSVGVEEYNRADAQAVSSHSIYLTVNGNSSVMFGIPYMVNLDITDNLRNAYVQASIWAYPGDNPLVSSYPYFDSIRYDTNGAPLTVGNNTYLTFTISNPTENPETYTIGSVAISNISTIPSAVPLPAALPLMLTGFSVLGFASRRKKEKI